MTPPFVVFSDLDGSLLDRRTYSSDAARPALEALADTHVPLVFCTSQTRVEVEHHRRAPVGDHDDLQAVGEGKCFRKEHALGRFGGCGPWPYRHSEGEKHTGKQRGGAAFADCTEWKHENLRMVHCDKNDRRPIRQSPGWFPLRAAALRAPPALVQVRPKARRDA